MHDIADKLGVGEEEGDGEYMEPPDIIMKGELEELGREESVIQIGSKKTTENSILKSPIPPDHLELSAPPSA